MQISKLDELYVALGCTLCGFFLSLIFDIFRALRKSFKFKDKSVALQDLTYWIIALLVIYTTMYYLNFAQLRLYQFVFMLTGAYIYAKTVSRYLTAFMCRVIPFFAKAFLLTIKLLITPFKALMLAFKKNIFLPAYRIFGTLYTKLTKTTHKFKKNALNFCKRFYKS